VIDSENPNKTNLTIINPPIFLTPLHYYDKLSNLLNVKIFVKHDDSFQFYGGGNKARKLKYIIFENQKKINAIVTAGGLQSNHVRAAALLCAQLGWKSIMIIHAKKPKNEYYTGNLKLTQLCGAEIRFVEMENVPEAMDKAMDDLKEKGNKPYYIWGGGHCVEGAYAYYEAVKEVKTQLKYENYPDYIVFASGTGTTQAGIIAGCNKFFPNTKVLGISIARNKERGIKIIKESFDELNNHLGITKKNSENIFFDDSFIGEGYEAIYPEVLKTIKWAAQTEGFLLDPTYTGKAFYGFMEYVKKGIIPKGKNVLFWHTGGLLNLISSKEI